MTSPDRYRNALAAIGLPDECRSRWRFDHGAAARRWRSSRVVMWSFWPRQRLIRTGSRGSSAVAAVGLPQVDTATRLAPDHAVKQLVDGEEFTLFGQRHRLCLVDTARGHPGCLPREALACR